MPVKDSIARRMMYASVCAYQIYNKGTIPSPVPGEKHRVESGKGYFYEVVDDYQNAVGFTADSESYTPEFYSDGSDDINAGLIGLTNDGYALVAIRGTIPPSLENNDLLQWIRDWANDADIPPMEWRPGGADYGKAETGFAKSTKKLWGWVETELGKIKDQAPNGVLITGHSKGGAMTYLMASLVQETWPELDGKIEVHAFAPAVSCDADFVSAYDAAGLSVRTFRYQVENDMVPFLPYWNGANVWLDVKFKGFVHELEWLAMVALAHKLTGGGYSAPGQFIYFDSTHKKVPGANVDTSALPAVAKALNAEEFTKIADAHSATDSYLLCFL